MHDDLIKRLRAVGDLLLLEGDREEADIVNAAADALAAQPAQGGEPVAWQWLDTGTLRKNLPKYAERHAWRPLYAAPQPQPVQGGEPVVTLESALAAMDHLSLHNGAGRYEEAAEMLAQVNAPAAPQPQPVQGGEPVAPDDAKVICPQCCHQFRAIPVAVQQLMLDAGLKPPFDAPQPQRRLTDEDVVLLLQAVDQIAREHDVYEYGLPLGFDDEWRQPQAKMIAAFRAVEAKLMGGV